MCHIRYRIKWRYLLFICAALLAGPSPGAAQHDTVVRFDLQIADGRLTEARKLITVKRGDRVEINWRADRTTVLHLHGYDIEVAPGADKPQQMVFTAHATGRFPIETHARSGEAKSGHHTVLLYLEVHPR
jgi:FtsP/CotA-like multicopper oxidase with cupredoxin domain